MLWKIIVTAYNWQQWQKLQSAHWNSTKFSLHQLLSSFIISFASFFFSGTVEDVDMQSDLATVRIPCKNLPVMKLGQSSNLRPGEFVIAMGSPLALSNTITTGVVSSVARKRTELGLRDRDVPGILTEIRHKIEIF